MKVGIINITGYAGSELARIIAQHPEVELVAATGRSAAGQHISEVFPHLNSLDLTLTENLDSDVDIVFSALPHKASAEALLPYIDSGLKVIDISADFRLKDPEVYKQWYQTVHPKPELLKDAVYGLPELHRAKIIDCNIIANPGCYPTSAIIGLAPAINSNMIKNDVIVDSKSGVSGAGRGLSLTTHYSEINENVHAYALGGHRHQPEISQELSLLNGEEIQVTFTPHLIPMTRGILSTCYAMLSDEMTDNDMDNIVAVYQDFYSNKPFVDVTTQAPQTKHTLGNNKCLVYPVVNKTTRRLTVISCLDNLVKGAAGAAVQNMNLMCGLPEDMALTGLAVYP
ncbi:MAG TPA: N-acetyl-gamma-glutamyl-phosphate reductase [Dehalococcoidia bacterium]|mgnify:FL=1|nr:N-acetyl-gamma-glutamyl-phosphate reductase [Dehalococcoidia bacterium]|tara:strand:- start:1794 stop:2816 length:1023 start_codon:yes stop_codon:yes gene_type:complete